MVQHPPGLCGDSQASQNQSKTIFIWWAEDEELFSPGPSSFHPHGGLQTLHPLSLLCSFPHCLQGTITGILQGTFTGILHRDITDSKVQLVFSLRGSN